MFPSAYFALDRIDSLAALLAGSLALVGAIYWFSNRNYRHWIDRGIPSPPTVPFIGSYFNLSVPNPLLYKSYVAKYGKVFGVFIGQEPILTIVDRDLIKRVLVKDFHIFRNRPMVDINDRIFRQNLAEARDETWKRIRSILSPMFTSAKVKKMEDLMVNSVSSIVDYFDTMCAKQQEEQEPQTIEARDAMGKFTIDVIAKCAFGIETCGPNQTRDQDNQFHSNARALFEFRISRFLGVILLPNFLRTWMINAKLWPLYVKEFSFFENLSRHLIQKRRKENEQNRGQVHRDLLQLMVNAKHNEDKLNKVFDVRERCEQEEGHYINQGKEELELEHNELRNIIGSKYLSEEEIMAQTIIFFLAGYETTSSTLAFCMFELTVNPEVQDRLYQELKKAQIHDPDLTYTTLTSIDYLDAVLSETLRKYPTALVLMREVSADYQIPELGLTLPKKSSVQIPVYAVHHSPDYFPDPEKFDPERFMPANRHKVLPYTYLPFGGGPRACIGMRFALAEMKLALARIVTQFQLVRTSQTRDKLDICEGYPLLKTSPVNVGIQRRVVE